MINVRRICVAYILYKRRNKKTRVHVDPFLENRLLAGAFVTRFGKLQINERKFKNYFRMSIRSFDELLCKIENKLQKSSLRRITIQPIERLAITLRYLATGNTFTDLHYSYVIGIATISEIIHECQVRSSTINSQDGMCTSQFHKETGWLQGQPYICHKWFYGTTTQAAD
nr:uncharacterized protein LOC117994402 isoform X2 [Maniola hyperantus]